MLEQLGGQGDLQGRGEIPLTTQTTSTGAYHVSLFTEKPTVLHELWRGGYGSTREKDCHNGTSCPYK